VSSLLEIIRLDLSKSCMTWGVVLILRCLGKTGCYLFHGKVSLLDSLHMNYRILVESISKDDVTSVETAFGATVISAFCNKTQCYMLPECINDMFKMRKHEGLFLWCHGKKVILEIPFNFCGYITRSFSIFLKMTRASIHKGVEATKRNQWHYLKSYI
jgi:hypothetical protein